MSFGNDRIIHVSGPSELPQCEHWAIIGGTSVHVPAEGVWAAGHGYPEHTDHYITYTAYLDEAEFQTALKSSLESKYSYSENVRGIHVQGIYQSKTHIELTEKK